MRRGCDDLTITLFKFGLLTVLAAQCIFPYPYHQAGRDDLEDLINETAKNGEQFNLERIRRNVSRHQNTHRSSPRARQTDFVFPEERIVPACKGSTYCETVDTYPKDAVNRAIQRNESIKYLESVDIIDLSPVEERIGQTDDISLCMSMEHLIFPQSAKNKDSEWKFVANQENFKQGVRIEKCSRENTSCTSIGSLAAGYRTNCKQKYVYRELASVMTNGTIAPDVFLFPSSCCCHASFNGNVLTRMGVDIVDQRSQMTLIKTRKRK